GRDAFERLGRKLRPGPEQLLRPRRLEPRLGMSPRIGTGDARLARLRNKRPEVLTAHARAPVATRSPKSCGMRKTSSRLPAIGYAPAPSPSSRGARVCGPSKDGVRCRAFASSIAGGATLRDSPGWTEPGERLRMTESKTCRAAPHRRRGE